MLDTDTKRRIDTARDILVGKVPDPKSQVEQITIALIYKFMNDMDLESEELGGKRKFFAGDWDRFSWAKLIHSGLGGQEVLNLYAEAISKMPQNTGVPTLFRDIFKNAFLPYRDPETLKSFLKIIDEFEYDHSERLGDAFEYLLSVLGSQGDAGQFRTPRHIIDFMVEILDPKKDETILDPACGTAGFLISSYKHILRSNVDKNGNSTLTPDERGKLAANIKGYDISPDMVRLSLVNLYLHGFTDPHIDEYDTLTSEERWNDTTVCCLANPPFMSPKGGIRPHKRFSIQSKRSEVLFVDYIAEHLTPNGRAAIIVPEGIIFQSQTAYKQLRKMLVKDYLVAVISLPAGVFQPYSGVKTSILIFDKTIAKQSDTLAFFKVENDGFGLGAQRRPIDKNDLPTVKSELQEYLQTLRNRKAVDELVFSRGLVVKKQKVAGNGEYNLSGERYREVSSQLSNYPFVDLESVAEIVSGQSPPGESYNEKEEGIPFFQGKSEFGDKYIGAPKKWTKRPQRIAESGDIIMSVRAPVGPVNITRERICIGRGLAAIRSNQRKILREFLFHILRFEEKNIVGDAGAAFSSINRKQIGAIQIPLPPLDIQKEIVVEIEGYQKVIDGAKAVIDNYRPHIPIHPDWPLIALDDLCNIKSGGTPSRSKEAYWNGTIPWITTSQIKYEDICEAEQFITDEGLNNSSCWKVPPGTILMAMYGQGKTRGRVGTLRIEAAINQACAAFIPKENLNSAFLFNVLRASYSELRRISDSRGGNQGNLSAMVIKQFKIPLPPLETQRSIVTEIEAEQALVNANKELIQRMEKKIEATLNRVWGEAETEAIPSE